jgi:signal transduction histidine kinase
MSDRFPSGRLHRLWPQKVRARLTLIYASLFFVAGCALLALTYGLLAGSLSPQPPAVSTSLIIQTLEKNFGTADVANVLRECEKPSPVKQPGHKAEATPSPAGTSAVTKPPPSVIELCKVLFAAGAASGSQAQRYDALRNLLVISLAGLGLMTVASGGLGWYMSGRVLRPVKKITETARRASEQHLGERLNLDGARDELKELADTFDDMLERLDAAFAAQRRFVANASHELRTPLTVMRTAIDVTLAKPSPTAAQLTDTAARVRRSVDKAEAMIEALLTLAVSEQGRRSTEFADLATLAEDALDDAAPQLERLGLSVESKLDPAGVAGDPQLLERMIGNLVDNAVRHNEPDGWLRLRTGTVTGTGAAYLEIANGGPVVPPDELPGLFEPFRRLKARTGAEDGVGLGLSIIRSVATAHQATVAARSQPTGGLGIRIEFRAFTKT